MKFSYKLLQKLCGFKNVSALDLATLLTAHLAETVAVPLAKYKLDKIVVAEILKVDKHPNADKLRLASIDAGVHGKFQIVCGAPNIAAGQKVPLALVGSQLPNGMTIKKAAIRGIESCGMLCAEDELGLGVDHTGILILPNELKNGTSLDKALDLDDVIFEIENVALTKRPDLFSHFGLAREIQAIIGGKNKIDFAKSNKTKTSGSIRQGSLRVEINNQNLCLRYMAQVFDNVKIDKSPLWLQNCLRNLGIRPINNIVDITNYVMVLTGQPLHAFDYHKLIGSEKKIIIRTANQGEKILALDGKNYELIETDLVIADSKQPIALAGIMGGELSGIDETTQTIVIESATFDPINIRKTAKRLNLQTEASIRFEKDLPVSFTETGLREAQKLILEIGGGKINSPSVDVKGKLAEKRISNKRKILLDLPKIKNVLGENLSDQTILSFLQKIDIQTEKINIPKKIVALAKAQIGKPYFYGSSAFLNSPDKFDCSSLVLWAYRQVGIELPRISIDQAMIGETVTIRDLEPGDLIFRKGAKPHVSKSFPDGLGHVGIYIGNNKVVHASGDAKKVIFDSLKSFMKQDFRVAKRIIRLTGSLIAIIPETRPDLIILEDVIEEVARLHGVEKIIEQPIQGPLFLAEKNKFFSFKRLVKDFLVALSFDEVYNYSFTGEQKEGTIKILNPISADLQYLRQNLKNGLLKNYEKNAPFYPSCRLFEIGKVFSQVGNEREQSDHLAGLIAEKSSDLFLLMKGIALAFFQKVNLDNNQLIFEAEKIFCGTRNIGFWASLDEAIFFEIDLEKLFVCDKKKIFYQPIPAYPPIKRDLAFLIDKKIVWQEIYQKIKNFDPLIKDIDLFDVFEDAKFGEKRSLAFHLTYQSTERTLTALEVEEKQKKLIIHLNQVFKAELRNF